MEKEDFFMWLPVALVILIIITIMIILDRLMILFWIIVFLGVLFMFFLKLWMDFWFDRKMERLTKYSRRLREENWKELSKKYGDAENIQKAIKNKQSKSSAFIIMFSILAFIFLIVLVLAPLGDETYLIQGVIQ